MKWAQIKDTHTAVAVRLYTQAHAKKERERTSNEYTKYWNNQQLKPNCAISHFGKQIVYIEAKWKYNNEKSPRKKELPTKQEEAKHTVYAQHIPLALS